jgi:hypothetical protein
MLYAHAVAQMGSAHPPAAMGVSLTVMLTYFAESASDYRIGILRYIRQMEAQAVFLQHVALRSPFAALPEVDYAKVCTESPFTDDWFEDVDA